ncbi:MAG: hypothetical protein HUU34_00530 [Saprospiraceae bacterium]|nr:hypothetical protein [Saprospiraceae bacterium]
MKKRRHTLDYFEGTALTKKQQKAVKGGYVKLPEGQPSLTLRWGEIDIRLRSEDDVILSKANTLSRLSSPLSD